MIQKAVFRRKKSRCSIIFHMKILLRDFNKKLEREDIFKPTIGNDSLHRDSNNNRIRITNFATSKNLVFKSTMLSHRNIH